MLSKISVGSDAQFDEHLDGLLSSCRRENLFERASENKKKTILNLFSKTSILNLLQIHNFILIEQYVIQNDYKSTKESIVRSR